MKSLFNEVLKNIRRDVPLSISTMCAIALVVTVFNIVLSLYFGSKDIVNAIAEKATLTAQIKDGTDFYQVGKLMESIEKLPQVEPPVVYTSGEQALAMIRSAFSLDDSIIRKYGLSLPGTLTVTVRDPNDLQIVSRTLEEPAFERYLKKPGQTQKQREEKILGQLSQNIKAINRFTLQTLLWVMVIFFVIAFMLISHVLHVHFAFRKHEFSLIKIFGFPRPLIHPPVLLEAMSYSCAAVLIAVPFSAVALFMIERDGSNLLDAFPWTNVVLFELLAAVAISSLLSAIVTRWYIYKQ